MAQPVRKQRQVAPSARHGIMAPAGNDDNTIEAGATGVPHQARHHATAAAGAIKSTALKRFPLIWKHSLHA